MADQSEDQNGLDSPLKKPPTDKPSPSASTTDEQQQQQQQQRTPDYKFLIEYGLDTKVAGRLDDIYKTGLTIVLLNFGISATIGLRRFLVKVNYSNNNANCKAVMVRICLN